jgi:hypothetical protein
MRKILHIIRYLFGFAEKAHTTLWLFEILGAMTVLAAMYAWVRTHMQEDVKWFAIVMFFIIGMALLTFPRLIYTVFRRRKSSTPLITLPVTQSHKTFEIRFDYLPRNMLDKDNGWSRAYPEHTEVKPQATLALDAPIAGSVAIEAPDGHAYDYPLPRNVKLSNRLVFAATYTATTMIFTKVELSSQDGVQTTQKWIKYEPGTGLPHPTPGYNDYECTFPIMGEPLPNGWRKFDISLPETVARTWGLHGLIFKGITGLRLRGSLSISPIEFFESC